MLILILRSTYLWSFLSTILFNYSICSIHRVSLLTSNNFALLAIEGAVLTCTKQELSLPSSIWKVIFNFTTFFKLCFCHFHLRLISHFFMPYWLPYTNASRKMWPTSPRWKKATKITVTLLFASGLGHPENCLSETTLLDDSRFKAAWKGIWSAFIEIEHL